MLKPGGQKIAETSLVSTFSRPQQPLELYEFETCPFCKKVDVTGVGKGEGEGGARRDV